MGIVRKLAETLAAAFLAGVFAVAGWNWASLPERIPIHFNLHGQPDNWGGKSMLIALCLIAAAAYILLSFVQRRPGMMNIPFAVDLENSEVRRLLAEMACILKASIMIVFFTIVWASVQVALGNAAGLPAGFLPLAVLLPMTPTVIYLARLRRP
jgi:uncharacterized membrane protein